MSLFLGFYSLRGDLDPVLVEPVLGDFGQGRDLEVFRAPGFLLATVRSGEALRLVREGDGSRVAGLAGNLEGVGASPLPSTFLGTIEDLGRAGGEGAFAAVRYDRAAHSLLLTNDPFGVHPVFLDRRGGALMFCSETAPLAARTDLPVALNHDALAEYFGLGLILSDDTLLAGISNLAPGTTLRAQDGEVREARYEAAPASASRMDVRQDLEELAHEAAATLRTIMHELAGDGTDVVHLLSGGADTRLMVSCLSAEQRAQAEFLTSCVSALDPSTDRDVLVASRLAARLGLHHQIVRIFFTEIPFGPDAFDRDRAVHPKRILGGWHGGEFLGGFGFKERPITPQTDRAQVDRRLEAALSPDFLRSLSRHPFDTYLRHLDEAGGDEFALVIRQFTRPFFSRIYNGSRGAWLQPCQLPAYRHSPFWDSRFLRLLLRVPADALRDYAFYDRVYREHFRELLDLPLNSPLSRRPGACMSPILEGTEPKDVVSLKYGAALERFRDDPATWARGVYADELKERVRDPQAPVTAAFVDAEAWLRRYVDRDPGR